MTNVLYHLRAERQFLQQLRLENQNEQLNGLITTAIYHNARAIESYCAAGQSIVEELRRMEEQDAQTA